MKSNKKIILLIITPLLFFIIFFGLLLISVLILFDFFGANLTKEKIIDNYEYSDKYLQVINKRLQEGYVPLQRILYFYLEDNSLDFDFLYSINQNSTTKSTKEIDIVCTDKRLMNNGACTLSNIRENNEYLKVTNSLFNYPLKSTNFSISSFYNQQRIIFGEKNIHSGWDIVAPAKTPVYSVCNGEVVNVNYTQDINIPYKESGNSKGNIIKIKCDQDYNEIYYVIYRHLYPNSALVKVGDKVSHWKKIASVGTTGRSTGNHLHYEVTDEKGNLIDGMQLIDFSLSNENGNFIKPFNPTINNS